MMSSFEEEEPILLLALSCERKSRRLWMHEIDEEGTCSVRKMC
jgi:hypothetical protein